MHPGDRRGSRDCKTGDLDGVKVVLVAKVVSRVQDNKENTTTHNECRTQDSPVRQ